MASELKIGIIGDFDPKARTHLSTNEALHHAGAHLGRGVSVSWVPTDALADRAAARLQDFAGIICSPGSPYRSTEGALAGIRFARERGYPFAGT
jgi:CTP synthase (UTP-ammonia lyase)